MSKTFTVNGTDRTSIIRRDSWTVVEAAYGGEVGVCGFDLDDTAGSLDVPAMKLVTVTESAASPTTMFTGYVNARGKGRGELGKVGDRRQWDVELLDLNTILDDQALVIDGANRPAETDYDRITWLLTTSAMTSLSVTAGVVPNTNTVTMEATDYRFTTGGCRRVLDDCAEAAGKNYFLYNYGSGNLLYYDKQTGTSLSSSARLTTDAADVDNSTTWAIETPVPREDPTRIYSKVILKYANGYVVREDTGTTSTYRQREIVVTDESITTEAAAIIVADQYLNASASEEETITCAVTLPAANLNDIRAGQRVQIKATHLDIDAYTYYRVTRRTVAGAPGVNGGTSDVLYRVGLEFAPDIKMTRFGAPKSGPTNTDCTDCTRKVALLPTGMDDNLSLAAGRGNMFVYDGTLLAKYDCGLNGSGSVTPNSAALDVIYHEPVYEALLAGDRAFYTGSVGTFGDDRWSNAVTVHAGDTMDNRKAWVVELDAAPWVVSLAAGAPTLRADGSTIEYVSNGVGNDIASMYHEGPGPWGDGTDDFDLYITGITFSAAHNNVQFLWYVGSNDERDMSLIFSVGSWTLTVAGTSTSGVSGALGLSTATDYTIRWQHHPSSNVSRAKIWATAGAEPGTWDATRDPSADAAASDDRFYQYFDNTTAAVTSHVGNLAFDGTTYDDFNRTTTSPDVGSPSGGGGSGPAVLRRRDMTDGSLEASLFIRYATFDVRSTPNAQHLFGILWDDSNGPFQRYSRTPATEDAEFSITGWDTDLADWNVDDSYNIYKLTTTGTLYRYDAAGAEVWSVDLNSDYSYQWTSRAVYGSAFGYGGTVLVNGSTVYVCGYIGGANWQSGGSEAVVLSLARSDGSLLDDRRLTTTGGNEGAQAIAMCLMGTCLWVAGAADGTDFEEQTLPATPYGWIAKMPQ